eukprot:TRINITY_DN18854_c0_g1_i1.p1 TRINITY_DN18854_c0_g1~~TRINITY_DN18854_c0_g1_i1.p1  ORF type:complete len:241 (+),score=68.99 TRINITY_DN18854_c0_g1_i1:253-975(+)
MIESFVLNISPLFTSGKELVPVHRRWKQIVEQVNAMEGFTGKIVDSSQLWARIELDEALLVGAVQTPALSFAVTLGVVVLYFQELRTTSIVGLCVLCTIAAMYLLFLVVGWMIGPIEGLCTTMMIGLSVDYILHMAIAFVRADGSSRFAKAQGMMGETSSTVLGSAVTTATSAAVLLFCQIPLFNKVGAIVVCNSVSSVIVSLTLLPALMLVYGPKDDAQGKCVAWAKARFDRDLSLIHI